MAFSRAYYVLDYRLYAGGDDEMFGTTGNDTMYGYGGNDLMYGGGGNDRMYGGSGIDTLYGGWGDDRLVGGDDDDYLDGGGGFDVLDGGSGNDHLDGGGGSFGTLAYGDRIYTGTGHDTIIFHNGSSGNNGLAESWFGGLYHDIVMDYEPGADRIDASVSGSAWNYGETTMDGAGYIEASLAATDLLRWTANVEGRTLTHVFVTDGVNGYLFSDFDGDHYLESGLELQGLTSLSQFEYSDII